MLPHRAGFEGTRSQPTSAKTAAALNSSHHGATRRFCWVAETGLMFALLWFRLVGTPLGGGFQSIAQGETRACATCLTYS